MTTFAENMKKSRLNAGFNLQSLSRKSGIAGSVIKRWEKGKHIPSLYFAIDCAQALGLSPGEYITGVKSVTNELYDDMSANMIAARKRRKLSINKLSSQSGISASVIKSMEKGSCNTNVRCVYAVANAMGMSLDEYILGEKIDE